MMATLRVSLFLLGLAVVVASVALVSVTAAGVLAGGFLCGIAYLMERDAG